MIPPLLSEEGLAEGPAVWLVLAVNATLNSRL